MEGGSLIQQELMQEHTKRRSEFRCSRSESVRNKSSESYHCSSRLALRAARGGPQGEKEQYCAEPAAVLKLIGQTPKEQ